MLGWKTYMIKWALHEVKCVYYNWNVCAITAYRVCSSCCFLIFWWEWEVGSCQEKSRFFLVGFQSPSRILFKIFMNKISSSSQGMEGVRLGGLRSSAFCRWCGSLWVTCSLVCNWVQSISSSKSEAIVLKSKMMEYPLQVGDESLPQLEELKYPVILFTSEGGVN